VGGDFHEKRKRKEGLENRERERHAARDKDSEHEIESQGPNADPSFKAIREETDGGAEDPPREVRGWKNEITL